MLVKVATALAALSLSSSSIWAEDTLVVVDNNGVILGPVISGATGGSLQWTFVYRQAGQWTTLRTYGPAALTSDLPASAPSLYFSASNCTGTPVMATPQDCCGSNVTPLTVLLGSTIYTIDTSAIVNLTVSSNRGTPNGGCSNFPPELVAGMAVSLWGTVTFTPPLSVILNPLLFNDGFGTGDPTRWSNY